MQINIYYDWTNIWKEDDTMELSHYDVVYRATPTSGYSKMPIYCHGEYEAIGEVKKLYPKAVIIEVKKR